MTTTDYTYGPLDPLADQPRYTSVADVKAVLGIPVTDTSKDDRITEAICSAEYAIDAELGRSFPDTGTNPKIDGIPQSVISVARAASVGIYKSAEAPFGSAGSDDWLGTISVPQIVSEMVRRNPQLLSFKVSWGVR